MRTSWLLVTAGILAACGTQLTIAPDGDGGTTGDGGVVVGDGDVDGGPPGDGSIVGAPCVAAGERRLFIRFD